MPSLLTGETRKQSEFTDELNMYARQVTHRYELLMRWGAVHAQLAPVALAIDNPTELNFPRTQVTLRLPGDVLGYFDTNRLEDLLSEVRPPVPWGLHTLGMGIRPITSNLLSKINPDGRAIVREGADVVVTLPPIDVRPRTKHPLEPVYLVVPDDYAGKTLEIGWRATSTGAAGDAEGTLEAEVGDPVDSDVLVEAAEKGD